MADSYKIKIGDYWITDSGLEGGSPCRAEVDGIDKLGQIWTGTSFAARSGAVHFNLIELEGKNQVISIRFQSIVFATLFNNLKTLFNETFVNETPFDVIMEGVPGNYTFTATAEPGNHYSYTGFRENWIEGLVINLKVT